ncbi:pre-mRNA-splicing factor ATP-dependent RNA helicase DEAH10 [Phalaenopsis equestris]|uniref:pre-mRNA-splicing factor ATP-dependent RNA helicase DEAH10 n=1 Tax=Phalaenopsis equestris TaxID=78828 RepID=UPI0009E64CE8|nr:pre-mRNA-splicing factor ATP-dependent RNA helicase DEAH10 [Phalaenopsis equestris]XP_020576186.1 pre-mRNA-splicing factor ATP-dependent RNA helicase DEAH10 [Phalaenopsis equestris]XP_020576187.1 pre-mRNA-splicing factor ATP-dependent RNA helicase DEAH10 [Phalaenopsis equestris]
MPSISRSPVKKQKTGNLKHGSKTGNHGSKLFNKSLDRKHWILRQRRSLPIASVERKLVDEIRKNDTVIIVGETGSGKTTQLPQYLFNAGFCHNGKVIGITQPRRVAAVTVAKRVAEECDVQLGQKVGYAIRFEDVTSSLTRIKYMTDGLLLREALLDPILSRYNIIIVDEAHERTVHTDVLLGLLKKVQNARLKQHKLEKPDINSLVKFDDEIQKSNTKFTPLKLIIMSASLDAKGFSEYFCGAKAFYIKGRQYPVDILYTYQPEPDYVDATLIAIFQIHLEDGHGDILAFLTGQEEIELVDILVHERLKQLPERSRNILTVPIYSTLPSDQQMNVFKPTPSNFRKVILATNIAETSVTIPGVKYVIDSGVVKSRYYNPITGMQSLIIMPISKAQALQRSGRAGREGPGKCFRLYPESEFWKFIDSTVPEIKRCNLSNVVLELKALGFDDIIGFDFMEKPSRSAIKQSLQELYLLGALTDDCKLSDPVGIQMARFPLDPIYSKALMLSGEFKCLEEMLIVVAMLSVESIFYAPREKLEEARSAWKKFSSPDGDHLTFVTIFRAAVGHLEKIGAANVNEKKVEKSLNKWCRDNFINNRSLKHALDVHSQIKLHLLQMDMSLSSCGDDMLQFHRCLTASFFLNAADKQPDGSYRVKANGQSVQIHPSSVLFRTKPECIIFTELIQTNQIYVRKISRAWLPELSQYYDVES